MHISQFGSLFRRFLWYRWTRLLLGKCISFLKPDNFFPTIAADHSPNQGRDKTQMYEVSRPNLCCPSMQEWWLLLVKRNGVLRRIVAMQCFASVWPPPLPPALVMSRPGSAEGLFCLGVNNIHSHLLTFYIKFCCALLAYRKDSFKNGLVPDQ